MLLQQENAAIDSFLHEYRYPLTTQEPMSEVRPVSSPLQVGAFQDPGIKRRYRPNEDTIFVADGIMPATSSLAPAQPFMLLVVADGMGGQAHGQEASQLAIRSLVEFLSTHLYTQRLSAEYLHTLLSESVQYANQMVYERNRQQHTVMGTTITAALVVEHTAYIAHVGDSRLYLYRAADGLSQITLDHSVVAAFVAAGIISPDEIYTHPRRNQIYRSLGSGAKVEVDTCAVSLLNQDVLLLCSDGLWEMVRDPEIAAIVATPSTTPSECAHRLIQAALEGGGVDNVSAIVARVNNQE